MTVLKFELEIDSLAHPELYEMIVAIENVSFRAERMRQLAATGLIWERLRLAAEPVLPGAGKPDGAETASHLALVISSKPKLDLLGLPVLRDEVAPRPMPRTPDADPEAPPPPVVEPLNAKPLPALTESATDSGPSVHMPGTRSRLMRMKNRGLFTNE